MIIAQAFNRSESSRDSDFSTCSSDVPLVVQFAAKDADELVAAAKKVWSAGIRRIDINCGCPQGWAMQEGLGAALSSDPNVVASMVAAVKSHLPHLYVSIKIRLHSDLNRTLSLIRQAEDAGVAFITVHGRTAAERTSVPVHIAHIRRIKEFAHVPIVANGDAFSEMDANAIALATGVDGVMSARGLLANPAMFGGYAQVPLEAVVDYLRLALQYGGSFFIHHHHIMYMVDRYLTPSERLILHGLNSLAAVVDFFRSRQWIPINWVP